MGFISSIFRRKTELTIVHIQSDMSSQDIEALVRNIDNDSEIIFPEGLFEVNLELRRRKNIIIKGAGEEKTTLRSRGENLRLAHVKFVKEQEAIVLYSENSKNLRIEGLAFEGGDHGILLINSKGNVKKCHSRNNKGIGIGGIASELAVRDSNSQSNWQGVVLFSDSTGEIVGNDVFDNKSNGINLHSSRATISNNRIHDNGENGVHLGRGSNGTITENEALRNGDEGINLVKSSGTIAGNTCDENGSHGIALNDESSATVENNSCSSNKGSGIAVFWSQANRIKDNSSSNNALYGVCIAHNSQVNLEHNDLNSNKKNDIYQE